MRVVAILLAAGSSRRFGGEKLLMPLRGRPLFEHALEALEVAAPARLVLGIDRGQDRPAGTIS